jgi:hypothetical protein
MREQQTQVRERFQFQRPLVCPSGGDVRDSHPVTDHENDIPRGRRLSGSCADSEDEKKEEQD